MADRARPRAGGTRESRRSGFGRVLITLYAVLALGATARSLTQIATQFDEAPLAYALSAFAGVVYCIATYALASRKPFSRPLALVAISVELAGVLLVGIASVIDRAAFPDETVWSGFGSGYGYVPLVLPLVGLWWLRTTAPQVTDDGR